ncbi:hypothetical protein AGABI2DRAFT_179644 [Agaricus bisporus var. bisporus H97]|uniref:hypothetical protein n=1 Tax=Agaricus bisporus var. bisporus (strain H97 / ATCC MYA-4626 / FGSC 10389) TaxID=936046 RepID=UPI00029F716C|nr:hypothetical protein AGABI2DRAFT_179644 [Agaricus bisporus var. bisporus H97]EKV45074.1 hypothetical protein AGABI2DRAFT_179644 [Agaricus bisporus var. bisporus H97]
MTAAVVCLCGNEEVVTIRDMYDNKNVQRDAPRTFLVFVSSPYVIATTSRQSVHSELPIPPATRDSGPLRQQKGMVKHAHNIAMTKPTFVKSNSENSKVYYYWFANIDLMNKLLEKPTPGAASESSARFPPPQFLELYLYFIANCDGQQKMRWVVSVAGVGNDSHVSVFFSVNGHDDGTKAIITLCYQLAAKSGPYRQLIEVARDPSLLQSSILVQPLVWLIANRHERHFTSFFARANLIPAYEKEEIQVDTEEGRADVEQFFRKRLEAIKGGLDSFDPHLQWPEEKDFWTLAKAAGGLFANVPDILTTRHLPLFFPSRPLTVWTTINLHLPTFIPYISQSKFLTKDEEDQDQEQKDESHLGPEYQSWERDFGYLSVNRNEFTPSVAVEESLHISDSSHPMVFW